MSHRSNVTGTLIRCASRNYGTETNTLTQILMDDQIPTTLDLSLWSSLKVPQFVMILVLLGKRKLQQSKLPAAPSGAKDGNAYDSMSETADVLRISIG